MDTSSGSDSDSGDDSEVDCEDSGNSDSERGIGHVVPSNGHKITIDNVDYRQEVHYMTQDHQTLDRHYLSVCATKNRVHGNHLSSQPRPVDGLKDMDNGLCIPSHLDHSLQRGNYITLIERVLVQNLPCLEVFKDVAVQHIQHAYTLPGSIAQVAF